MTKKRCLTLFVFSLALLIGVNKAQAELRVVEPSTPVALAPFSLEDHRGEPFTQQNYEGHWSMTLIGFTYCPDVCPFVLDNLAQVVSEMKLRVRPDNLPQVVFLAIDPARDKANLADYVDHFDPTFIGVTGDHKELKKLVDSFDGFYRLGKPDKDGDYEVQHSASVIVTGPDGRIHFKLSPPMNPGEVAEFFARRQLVYRRQQKE